MFSTLNVDSLFDCRSALIYADPPTYASALLARAVTPCRVAGLIAASKWFAFIVVPACMLAASGCGGYYVSAVSHGISVSGVNTLRVGQTTSFSASASDPSDLPVSWTVDGFVGGTATLGTISRNGIYSAPAMVPVPNSITIGCASLTHPTDNASLSLTIWNPVPVIQSATAAVGENFDFIIDIIGSGFIANSTTSFDGTVYPSVYMTANHLRATVPPGGFNEPTTVAVVSNPNPGSANSASYVVALPSLPKLFINGPGSVRAGARAIFTPSIEGFTDTTVNWWVNGTAGGDVASGTISNAGVYTAPMTLPSADPILIGYSPVSDPALTASLKVTVENPVPFLESGKATDDGRGNFVIDLYGTGFTPVSFVALNATIASPSFQSASHLQVSVPQARFTGPAVAAAVGNPSPGAATSAPIQLSLPRPFPTTFHALTGCTNPNVVNNPGEGGTTAVPLYTDLNYQTVLIGSPVYTRNTIFWIAREAAPGESVVMDGAFTASEKTIRVAVIQPGTTDWQAVVRSSQTIVAATQQNTTALSFVVPPSLGEGIYGFEIDDPSAPPIQALANVPFMEWAIGVPSTQDDSTALQHPVYDCGAEQGGTLSVVGMNFVPTSQVVLQSSSGEVFPLATYRVEPTSASALVPAALPPGTYNMWVGDPDWSPTSSPAALITIYAPGAFTSRLATCPDLVGDGKTDNQIELQSCADLNAPQDPGEIVYIMVPEGIFVLGGSVAFHSEEVLVGVSAATTKFVGQPKGTAPSVWFAVPQHFGMVNIDLEAPANPSVLVSAGMQTGSPLTSGHLYFSNDVFKSSSDVSSSPEQMVEIGGPDVQVFNTIFTGGSLQDFHLNFADGALISGAEYHVNNSYLNISNSQNVMFVNNLTHSDNPPGPTGGAGLSLGRSFNDGGPSALSRNIYIAHNTFEHMGSTDQQIVTTDGGGGAYYGGIAASTADTVLLADDPNWGWVGKTNPEASVITIVAGTGVGQFALLKTFKDRAITLLDPWKVQPDLTSIVTITTYQLNITIVHNEFVDTLGQTIGLSGAYACAMEDNHLTNSGTGIQFRAYGPYGGPVGFGHVLESVAMRNIFEVGDGTYLTPSADNNVAGIGIFDGYGAIVAGLVISGNRVPSSNTIYSTNGTNGISGVVIEFNEASWYYPSTPIPGFLVQYNTSQ